MKNIPERVEKEIIQLAKQYDIQKVILFGSRARGDNWERSDIDLAVSGGDIPRFALDLDEEVWTLLLFDVPQGGILSPLLSNVVLNELDWWIASQWENHKTHHSYKNPSRKYELL